MATVVGKTSAKIDELLDTTVASGSMDTSGQITLTTKGGATSVIGTVSDAVVGAEIGIDNVLRLTKKSGEVVQVGAVGPSFDSIWPIGSIYMSVNSADPATILGAGTWSRWGQGRVPVSVDELQPEFDTVEELGGEKEHILTEPEMPQHNHGESGSHDHDVNYSAEAGSAYANLVRGSGTTLGKNRLAVDHDGAHTHTSQGGGLPHNNLQPYITCYMWKRTA